MVNLFGVAVIVVYKIVILAVAVVVIEIPDVAGVNIFMVVAVT